jgi:hypothetical protein
MIFHALVIESANERYSETETLGEVNVNVEATKLQASLYKGIRSQEV